MKKLLNKLLSSSFTVLVFNISVLLLTQGCSKFTKSPDPGKITTGSSNIVYTDVNPDSTVSNETYRLDLNNDGVADFVITETPIATFCGDLGGGAGIQLSITPTNTGNAVMGDQENLALALDSAEAIAPDFAWASALQVLLAGITTGRCHPFVRGHWISVSDKYLGLKFTKGNNSYYGWARFTSSNLPSMFKGHFTLQDYAYNSIPNQPILAGQTK